MNQRLRLLRSNNLGKGSAGGGGGGGTLLLNFRMLTAFQLFQSLKLFINFGK